MALANLWLACSVQPYRWLVEALGMRSVFVIMWRPPCRILAVEFPCLADLPAKGLSIRMAALDRPSGHLIAAL